MNRNAGTIFLVFLLAAVLLLSGCTEKEGVGEQDENRDYQDSEGDENVSIRDIRVFSDSFEPKGMIPEKYTCYGENVNPSLRFEGIPEEAKSLVLIMDDPDAPMGTFTQWVIWDIEPVAGIEEDSIPGVEGMNDFRKIGYGGPCPPSGTHRYFFRVYALDKKLEIKAGAGRKDVENAMIGHILAEGELVGKYGKA
jgi:Raf kinase inhibitor-like YbhB/YbcL family protein